MANKRLATLPVVSVISYLKNVSLEPLVTPNASFAQQAVLSSVVAGLVLDEPLLRQIQSSSSSRMRITASLPLRREYFFVAPSNSTLLRGLNTGILSLRADAVPYSAYNSILDRWQISVIKEPLNAPKSGLSGWVIIFLIVVGSVTGFYVVIITAHWIRSNCRERSLRGGRAAHADSDDSILASKALAVAETLALQNRSLRSSHRG